MPTSEDLVPNGLPQGSRQEVVAGMRQAGLPTATSQPQQPGVQTPAPVRPQPPSPGPDGAPVSGVDLLRDRRPEDFQFIGGPQEESPAVDQPDSVLSALGASAQSSFARAVIARLQTKG